MVREALSTGAHGYITKADAGRYLLDGVNAVLRCEQFIGGQLFSHEVVDAAQGSYKTNRAMVG